MRTDFFVMYLLDGNDCQQCSLSHDWRHFIFVNPKNGKHAPVLRTNELEPEIVEMICMQLEIDPPGDIITILQTLRNKI